MSYEDDHSDDDGAQHRVGAYIDPPVEQCPVVFLGHYGEHVVFMMPEGTIRAERASDIGKKLKIDIFNRYEGVDFLNNWRADDDKLMRDQAASWFVRKARELPYWDNSRPQRSLGVWPRANGDVILHRGSELVIYPRDPDEAVRTMSITKAMRDGGEVIYALRSPRPKPDRPASSADGKWLRRALDAWNFEDLGEDGLTGADVTIGWIGAGLLGAVTPFRPHILVQALMGSGKTTLMHLVQGALSALAGDVIDAFTPAGLANDLSGMARPVMIDEAEASADPFGKGPIEQALDLIRRMATGTGAVRKMGTIGGGSITQTAVGCVMMGAVNPVKLGPADASRIAEVRLLELNAQRRGGSAFTPTSDGEITALINQARELAPQFLSRALLGSHRYKADFAAMKAAFRDQGESPRAADLAASLAAGSRLLTADDPLTPDEAGEEAQFWRGLMLARLQAETVTNPGRDCWSHLMAATAGHRADGRLETIGEQINKWASNPSNEDARIIATTLGANGLKLIRQDCEDGQNRPFLVVANAAAGLKRMFEGTQWRDWRSALLNLDQLGDQFKTTPVATTYFSTGVVSRGLAVPLAPWLPGNGSRLAVASDDDIPDNRWS